MIRNSKNVLFLSSVFISNAFKTSFGEIMDVGKRVIVEQCIKYVTSVTQNGENGRIKRIDRGI